MAYMDSGLKKFTSIHDRLALQLSKCQEEASIIQMDDNEENYPDPERAPEKETFPATIDQ